jgi:ATP:ADP antiporter, AAA family
MRFPVERHERPAVVAAFFLFFCVMAGYFAVRPVRDTVGTLLGGERVTSLWTFTWIGSLLLVPIYGAVVARLPRRVFLPWTYGTIAAALVLLATLLPAAGTNLVIGRVFYVFISVLNLFTISVFWSFLLELFRREQTKRLFGVIAAGGTAGALAGPLFTDVAVPSIGNTGVLVVGAGLFVAAIGFQRLLLSVWTGGGSGEPEDVAAADESARAIGGGMFAGIGLVLKSPYMLGISLFVVMLAAVSTVLYFEQLRLVELTYPAVEDRTRVFARMDWIVQSLTIVSQIFLTGRIATRRGLAVLLSMVPTAMIVGFLILAAWNTFPVLAIIFIARRFGEYAFVRPGREMLWAPLDPESKYKAKNIVDVQVYRGADVLAAQIQRAIGWAGFGPQALAVYGSGLAVAWAINAWLIGKRYERLSAVTSATSPSS